MVIGRFPLNIRDIDAIKFSFLVKKKDMNHQSVLLFVALGLLLIGLMTILVRRRRDKESFLSQPRQLLRTFNAPLRWYSIFRITRISPRDPTSTYESNQLIIRRPGSSAARSNVYPFSFVSQTIEDPTKLTISQVSSVTSKRKELQDGEELEPVQPRLPISVRVHRSSVGSRAMRSVFLQVQTDPQLRGLYECLLQSYDSSLKFEAIQPKDNTKKVLD